VLTEAGFALAKAEVEEHRATICLSEKAVARLNNARSACTVVMKGLGGCKLLGQQRIDYISHDQGREKDSI
jgi:hypothetical protein